MKILILGFLAFSAWSSFSTYVYVCKIRGLCDNPSSMPIAAFTKYNIVNTGTVDKFVALKPTGIPHNQTIYFAFDKSEFTATIEYDQYFNESKAFLNQNTEAKLSITGHTDSIGSDKYNQALGYRRAQTMKHYFESRGVSSNKIIVESWGEKNPGYNNNTTEGRANNRSAVLTIKN